MEVAWCFLALRPASDRDDANDWMPLQFKLPFEQRTHHWPSCPRRDYKNGETSMHCSDSRAPHLGNLKTVNPFASELIASLTNSIRQFDVHDMGKHLH